MTTRCSHSNHDGKKCQRDAVRKCVNKRTEETHFCCGLHSTMHPLRNYSLFKIDENGRSINPGTQEALA